MKNYILLLCMLFSSPAFVQENFIFSGKVTDAGTGEPLGFASIGIKGKRLGTISNSAGDFIFKIPSRFRDDTVMISFLGYEVFTVPVNEIDFPAEINIRLASKSIQLDEIVITSISGLELFLKAIDHIPLNYEMQPVMMQAFYRELMHVNKKPFKLVEAVTDIHKSAYGQKGRKQEEDQVRIVKARQARDTTSGKLPVQISEGPNMLLNCDYIRSRQGVFDPKKVKNYIFEYKGVTLFGDREVYKVSFDQAPGVKKALFQGDLYIDSKTYAFVHIEEKISERGQQYAMGNEFRVLGIGIHVSDATKKVSYKLSDGKWYLSHSMVDMAIEVNAKKNFILNRAAPYLFENGPEVHLQYNFYLESVITRLHHVPLAPIPEKEIFSSKTKFDNYSNDERFWENYNMIKGTEQFDDILKEINKKEE